MPFVITDPCIETKDTACVDVCPVDCIHPRKDEPEFAAKHMLYIHPEECIYCGACVPAGALPADGLAGSARPTSMRFRGSVLFGRNRECEKERHKRRGDAVVQAAFNV